MPSPPQTAQDFEGGVYTAGKKQKEIHVLVSIRNEIHCLEGMELSLHCASGRDLYFPSRGNTVGRMPFHVQEGIRENDPSLRVNSAAAFLCPSNGAGIRSHAWRTWWRKCLPFLLVKALILCFRSERLAMPRNLIRKF